VTTNVILVLLAVQFVLILAWIIVLYAKMTQLLNTTNLLAPIRVGLVALTDHLYHQTNRISVWLAANSV
jgi:hypothetical protein